MHSFEKFELISDWNLNIDIDSISNVNIEKNCIKSIVLENLIEKII